MNICEVNETKKGLNIKLQDLLTVQCTGNAWGFRWSADTCDNSQVPLGTVPRWAGSTGLRFAVLRALWSHVTGFH